MLLTLKHSHGVFMNVGKHRTRVEKELQEDLAGTSADQDWLMLHHVGNGPLPGR